MVTRKRSTTLWVPSGSLNGWLKAVIAEAGNVMCACGALAGPGCLGSGGVAGAGPGAGAVASLGVRAGMLLPFGHRARSASPTASRRLGSTCSAVVGLPAASRKRAQDTFPRVRSSTAVATCSGLGLSTTPRSTSALRVSAGV